MASSRVRWAQRDRRHVVDAVIDRRSASTNRQLADRSPGPPSRVATNRRSDAPSPRVEEAHDVLLDTIRAEPEGPPVALEREVDDVHDRRQRASSGRMSPRRFGAVRRRASSSACPGRPGWRPNTSPAEPAPARNRSLTSRAWWKRRSHTSRRDSGSRRRSATSASAPVDLERMDVHGLALANHVEKELGRTPDRLDRLERAVVPEHREVCHGLPPTALISKEL
jgi:hypothetical protein